jgi:predicted HicB family RNase H-like nuclease
MATKAFTVRIDERVIDRAREYSKESGLKLYALVESALRNAVPPKKAKAAK